MVISRVRPPRRYLVASLFSIIVLAGCCPGQPYAFQLLVLPTTSGFIASALPYAFWPNWSGKVFVVPSSAAGRAQVFLLAAKDMWSAFASLEACLQARTGGLNDVAARSLTSENIDLKKSAEDIFHVARFSRCVPLR